MKTKLNVNKFIKFLDNCIKKCCSYYILCACTLGRVCVSLKERVGVFMPSICVYIFIYMGRVCVGVFMLVYR